jgi:hypothetical protein
MKRKILIDAACGIVILGALVLLLEAARTDNPPLAITATVIAVLTVIFQMTSARRRKVHIVSDPVLAPLQTRDNDREMETAAYAGRS